MYKMFKAMDTNNSGTITFEELKGLHRQGSKLVEADVKKPMEAADVDGNGKIDFKEYISATMHINKMEKHWEIRQLKAHAIGELEIG